MTPSLAIIGGSGLYEIDSLEVIERHNPMTPFGETSDEIIEGKLSDAPSSSSPATEKATACSPMKSTTAPTSGRCVRLERAG